MKRNTLVLVGLVGASLAGCEIRCLSPKGNPPPKTQTTGTGAKLNVLLVGSESADAGEPGDSMPPSDAEESSQGMHTAKAR